MTPYFGTLARLWLTLQAAYDLATTQAKEGAPIFPQFGNPRT